MSLFRYPGGKEKFVPQIMPIIHENSDGMELYVEPFAGAGGIAQSVICGSDIFDRYVINDADPSVFAVWMCVKVAPSDLSELVWQFKPSVDKFFEMKEGLLNLKGIPQSGKSMLEIALSKIAVHQMSFSGLGTMAGGPIGGIAQESAYGVDCRWNPARIVVAIQDVHAGMSRKDVHVECLDYRHLLDRKAHV